jgi:hypothetical protein
MMHDNDGDRVTPLQFAQECEQWCDLAADVFVDAMQADEWIEDEQPRPQPGDRLVETGTVGLEIKAQARRGDHLQVEFGEVETGGGADTVEAAANDVECVFGGIEQDATGADDREAAQTGSSGGDGDGQIEGQEGFAALGLAADDADRFFRPQVGDEPALLLGSIEEAMSRLDRKQRHRRRRVAGLVSLAVAPAQVSKNSASSI